MDVTDMLSEFTDAGYGDVSTTRQVAYINRTLSYITFLEPWPFREKNLLLTFDGTNAYPSNWPSDFSQIKFVYDTNTGDAVWPERVETVRDRYAANMSQTDAQTIFAYYFIDKTAYFYPQPTTAVDTIYMDYIAKQAELTSSSVAADILLPSDFHDLIVSGSLYRLAILYDDTDIAPLWQAEFEGRLSQAREELLRRQYQRPDRIFVVDESDDWDNTPFLP